MARMGWLDRITQDVLGRDRYLARYRRPAGGTRYRRISYGLRRRSRHARRRGRIMQMRERRLW